MLEQVRRGQSEANGKGWRYLKSAFILVILAVVQARMQALSHPRYGSSCTSQQVPTRLAAHSASAGPLGRIPPPWLAGASRLPGMSRALRLRGGMGRIKRREVVDKPLKSELEQLANSGTEEVRLLAQRAGYLEDKANEGEKESWLDRQRQVALRVLRRRANADRRERQRQHVSGHGVDAGAIERAEELQVMCAHLNLCD